MNSKYSLPVPDQRPNCWWYRESFQTFLKRSEVSKNLLQYMGREGVCICSRAHYRIYYFNEELHFIHRTWVPILEMVQSYRKYSLEIQYYLAPPSPCLMHLSNWFISTSSLPNTLTSSPLHCPPSNVQLTMLTHLASNTDDHDTRRLFECCMIASLAWSQPHAAQSVSTCSWSGVTCN